MPHVREAVPTMRTTLTLPAGRTATVLALDTTHAADTVLLRPDLAPAPMKKLLAGLGPSGESAGARVPAGATRLTLTATLLSSVRDTKSAATVTQTLEDDHGVPYTLPSGDLPADGRPHTLSVELPGIHGPLKLTGVQLVLPMPSYHAEQHTLTLDALTATTAAGDGTASAPAGCPGRRSPAPTDRTRATPEPRRPARASAPPRTRPWCTARATSRPTSPGSARH